MAHFKRLVIDEDKGKRSLVLVSGEPVDGEGQGAIGHFTFQQEARMIRRIREVVRAKLSPQAIVIVASKGDPALLDLYGRRAWHFLQTQTGEYAGYKPVKSMEAIVQLELLRPRRRVFALPEHVPLVARVLRSV